MENLLNKLIDREKNCTTLCIDCVNPCSLYKLWLQERKTSKYQCVIRTGRRLER